MIKIIIPPVSDCFMPTLGAAQIVGYLKNRNIDSKLYDANQNFLQKIRYYTKQNSIFQKYCYKNDSKFHELVETLNVFSIEHPHFKVSPDDFFVTFDWHDTQALSDFLKSDNELSDILNSLSCVKEVAPHDIVGLSISYEMQLIPSLLIAKIIKERVPTAKIVLGGSFFYNYENDILSVFCELDFIDYVIIGCGELVFEYMANDNLDSLENMLMWNYEGRVIINSQKVISPTVYCPDFSDMDFNKYPSVTKAFPYMINNKCYYGHCSFCNGDKVTDAVHQKDVISSFKKISDIANNIGINNVYIVDAALSPKNLAIISGLEFCVDVKWIANARFDEPLLNPGLIEGIAKQGCEMLRFGLESGSQHVLDLMNKGTKIPVAEKILKKCHENGIKNHIYLMFGYMGETDEDRNTTLKLLQRNREYIYSYSISLFQPMPNTPVYERLLQIVTDKENPYNEMIDIVYKGEENYKKILRAVEAAESILKDYAYTNKEHYSANIFADSEISKNEIVISSKPITTEDVASQIISSFKNRIKIIQKQSPKTGYCKILDFYKNTFIEIFADISLTKMLMSDFSGNIKDLLINTTPAKKPIAKNMLDLISQFSDCVMIDRKNCAINTDLFFDVLKADDCIYIDSSVQFDPQNKVNNGGGTIWTE